MQLFKRVLLSLFPEEIVAQSINPANMFVSFISTKEFFSVINRKLVENYKLNLYDISLDPFEFKIGFWNQPVTKPKDTDIYYGYCSAANLNWYRFFNTANIWTNLALVTSLYVKEVFRKYDQIYFLNFLYAVYLLCFVFTARIKVFPYKDKKLNYNRFIDILFSFYAFVFQQTGQKLDVEIFKKIKKELISQVDIYFLLFEVYSRFNDTLSQWNNSSRDYYSRLFYDELQWSSKNIINEFLWNIKDYTTNSSFSGVEWKLLQFILPADILIRYLFMDLNMSLVVDTVISRLYDKNIVDEYLKKTRQSDSELEKFILYITDYRLLKKNFFAWVQKYIVTHFKDEDKTYIKEELDDLMSSIWDNMENIENFKIPERIKKESKIMEKILNFYVTLVGWMNIARWDSMFLKLFRKNIVDVFMENMNSYEKWSSTLYYYGSLLYQYGKNVFYYEYAAENIRAWKQKFLLPYKSDIKNVYSNMNILWLFDQYFLAVHFQDINPKDLKIYVKNKQVIDNFKKILGKQISSLVKKNNLKLVEYLYAPLVFFLSKSESVLNSLKSEFNDDDIFHLKENIYNFDFWLHYDFCRELESNKAKLRKTYSDFAILWILANFRETFFWFLLYYIFVKKNLKFKKDMYKLELLKNIYIKDILNVDEKLYSLFDERIKVIIDKYEQLAYDRIEVDDNNDYLKIWLDNWLVFCQDKNISEAKKNIIWEDIVWFRWYLKNITYYNKRFLIPK